jgi:signal transduction histidine kinase
MDGSRRVHASLTNPRVVDALVVLACLALTVLAVKAQWAPVPRPVIAVAGALGSLAQWRRRQWPLAAALVGGASYVLSGNPGPLLAGLYSGAAHGRARQVWLSAVAGWAGLAGFVVLDEGRLGLDDLLFTAAGAALVTAVGVYVSVRRTAWRERLERAEAERRLHEQEARAAERDRIAREMHDVLAHKVSLIAVHAGALELTAGGDPGRTREGAALIRTTAREALQELRDVLGVLRVAPPAADEPSDLDELVRAATDAGQPVTLRDTAGPRPPSVARVVHRIAQEGLTNARKHAPGAPVTIVVDRADGGGVAVTVRNPAVTADPLNLPGSGAGLVGLAERVRLADGMFHSGPRDDGWELRAVIPAEDGS